MEGEGDSIIQASFRLGNPLPPPPGAGGVGVEGEGSTFTRAATLLIE